MKSHVRDLTAPPAHLEGGQIVVAILALFWFAGIVASGLRIMSASRKTRELLNGCVEIDDDDLQTELAMLCSRTGIRRAPRLLSGDVDGPLVCGSVPASIILPDRLLGDSGRAELHLALAHELAHVKRRDVAWAWLPMLARWFFFFNPLVWLLRKEWLVAQEAACDLLAVEATGAARVDYGRMLLSCVTRVRTPRVFAAAGITESHETLKRRLWAMATLGNASRKKQIVIGIAVVVLAVAVIVPWMLTSRGHIRLLPSAGGQMTKAEVDAIIPPPPAELLAIIGPDASPLTDSMRAIYASLPVQVRQQVNTKGEYAFHLSDLPKEQADFIRGIVENDKGCLYPTISNWQGHKPGEPLDWSKITVLFQKQAQHVALRFRCNGCEANWCPFGMWTGR